MGSTKFDFFFFSFFEVILFFFNILGYALLPRTAKAIKNHLKEKVRTWAFSHETRREQVA